MHKMICFSILVIFSCRLIAQDNAGQLVFFPKENFVQFLNRGHLYHQPGKYSQRKSSLLWNEPEFKGLATQFIKPSSTAGTFFLKVDPGITILNFTTPFGWVCRQEWNFEKTTRIPLRIRLGNKEQVDYLEGKTFHH